MVGLKIVFLLLISVFVDVKKGMCELRHWLAQKHTTVDVGMLITSKNGDRKTMQPIGIANGTAWRMAKWNLFSQLGWTSIKLISIKKI